MDETGFWVGMSRRLARSLEGNKAFALKARYKGEKITLIGAMSIEGVVATKVLEKSMKGDDFYKFPKEELVPKLRSGHVIVMDNLNIHKMKGIEELVEAKGARIEYLPISSPDFNPIEMLWSELKSMVQKFRTRTIESLEKLIEMAIRLVCKSHLEHWFTKCCYCTK